MRQSADIADLNQTRSLVEAARAWQRVRGVVHKKLKEWCEGGEAAAESEVRLWKGMEGGAYAHGFRS